MNTQDIWELGPHRVICGDSTSEDTLENLFGCARADMVFSDPPYGVSYQSTKDQRVIGDCSHASLILAFRRLIDFTTDDARVYLCGPTSKTQVYMALFDCFLGQTPKMLIWDKGHFVMRRNNYHSRFELIFFGWKGKGGGPDHWYGDRKQADIWEVKRENTNAYVHPTQKPVALPERAISNSCPPGGIVFDCFLGSGSTLLAAERVGRRCFGVEIDPYYCELIAERYRAYCRERGVDAVVKKNGIAA